MSEDESPLQQVNLTLTGLQTAVGIAGALGVATAGRSVWRRATRKYDERFLLELANHEAALLRADQLHAAIEREATPAAAKAMLRETEYTLRMTANARLERACARTRWENSRWQAGGYLSFVLAALSFMAAVVSVGLRPPVPAATVACVSLFGFFGLVCVLWVTIVKDVVLDRFVARARREAAGSDETAGPVRNTGDRWGEVTSTPTPRGTRPS